LAASEPAPPASENAADFAEKQSEFEINNALKALLSALQHNNASMHSVDTETQKPRRVLLCLGEKREPVAQILAEAGYRVYIAETPAQANERLREGKTEIVIFSPDFAAEYGGAAVIQQRANAMYTSERRRLYLVSLEDGGTTMNAQEAFLRNLNLIVNSADIAQMPLILNRAIRDFNGLYHYFNTAMGIKQI
jgi:PleD family two-component response regulator